MLDVSNAGEALLVSEQHAGQIQLMLTDVVMPRMTGTELAARLRPIRPEMRIVYMSGYNQTHFGTNEKNGTHEAFIAKPISVDVLLEAIRRVLDA